MNKRIPNPDCRDGKHTICDGHGWDMDADTAVRCPCHCHAGPPLRDNLLADRLGIGVTAHRHQRASGQWVWCYADHDRDTPS